MTGRTHDLAAFTALNYVIISQPLHEFSLATAIAALSANLIGGLAPDIDQSTGELWRRIPVGTFVGKLIAPLFGGHRFLSHSLVGLVLFGLGLNYLLKAMSTVLLVDMTVVWGAFMIGFFSHLIMDTLTREGVPWLFPIPIRFGFPPFRQYRVKTGGLIEKVIIFPGLLLANGYMYYNYYPKFLSFLHHYVK